MSKVRIYFICSLWNAKMSSLFENSSMSYALCGLYNVATVRTCVCIHICIAILIMTKSVLAVASSRPHFFPHNSQGVTIKQYIAQFFKIK